MLNSRLKKNKHQKSKKLKLLNFAKIPYLANPRPPMVAFAGKNNRSPYIRSVTVSSVLAAQKGMILYLSFIIL